MPVFKQYKAFSGRYLLGQPIGDGGFSEVWKAIDQMAHNAGVALKMRTRTCNCYPAHYQGWSQHTICNAASH